MAERQNEADWTASQADRRVMVRHDYGVAPHSIVLGVGILLGSILLLLFVHAVLAPLFLVAASIIIAEALRPAVDGLNRRGIPRGHAVLLVYGVLAAMAFLILSFLLNPFLAQVGSLIANRTHYVTQAQQEFNQLQQVMRDANVPASLSSQANAFAERTVQTVIALPQQILGVFITVLIMAFTAFFWLTSTPQLKQVLLSITPASTHETLLSVLSEESRVLGGWVRGVLINMTLLGGVTAVALLLLRVPYALLLGVLTGLTQLIPYVGPWISGVPTVTLAYLSDRPSPNHAIWVAVVYIVIQEIASIFFVPLVMRGTIRLHPLLTTIALLLGVALFGVAGAVLSVPLTAALEVLFNRLALPALQRRAQRRDAADRAASPPPATERDAAHAREYTSVEGRP